MNWEKNNGRMMTRMRIRENRDCYMCCAPSETDGSSTRPRQMNMDESDDEGIEEGSVSGGEEYAELVGVLAGC